MATLFALTGCGGASTGWIDADSANVEYRQEAQDLTLPDAVTWPTSPMSDRAPDGGKQYYEVGSGRVQADLFWACAWAHRIDEAPGDVAARGTFAKIRSLQLYTGMLPQDKAVMESLVSAIDRGDSNGPAAFSAAMC